MTNNDIFLSRWLWIPLCILLVWGFWPDEDYDYNYTESGNTTYPVDTRNAKTPRQMRLESLEDAAYSDHSLELVEHLHTASDDEVKDAYDRAFGENYNDPEFGVISSME